MFNVVLATARLWTHISHRLLVVCACGGRQAGMVGVDKKLVNKVVYDMSKNSRHYKNAKRLDAASDRCVCAPPMYQRVYQRVYQRDVAHVCASRRRIQEMLQVAERTKHSQSPALRARCACVV